MTQCFKGTRLARTYWGALRENLVVRGLMDAPRIVRPPGLGREGWEVATQCLWCLFGTYIVALPKLLLGPSGTPTRQQLLNAHKGSVFFGNNVSAASVCMYKFWLNRFKLCQYLKGAPLELLQTFQKFLPNFFCWNQYEIVSNSCRKWSHSTSKLLGLCVAMAFADGPSKWLCIHTP